MSEPFQLLIVDDDVELCELLAGWLTHEGFQINASHDTATAMVQLSEMLPDVLILDVMLPDGSGLDLLKRVRERYPALPVLMLSARGEPLDRILGLELGADDYLTKPCDPRELTARLRAILRRRQPLLPESTSVMNCGDLMLSLSRGVAHIGEQEVTLTMTESRLLEALLRQPGEPVSKDTLSQHALGRKLALYDRSLDMHISNLRKKLGSHPDERARIVSLRGRGYAYLA